MQVFLVIVGRSASGKSALAKALTKLGYRQMKSYTTRPRRDRTDNDYIFVTDEVYDGLPNRDAEVGMRGYRYCTNFDEINTHDFKILEPSGLAELLENYKGDKPIVSLLLNVPVEERVRRLKHKRNLSDDEIAFVLAEDDKKFGEESLKDINIVVTNDTKEDFETVVKIARDILESVGK